MTLDRIKQRMTTHLYVEREQDFLVVAPGSSENIWSCLCPIGVYYHWARHCGQWSRTCLSQRLRPFSAVWLHAPLLPYACVLGLWWHRYGCWNEIQQCFLQFPKQIHTVVFYKVSMKPPSMGLWLSDIVWDLGQLALILFVSLEETVLISNTVMPAPGSPSSNKQFPCLQQPFQRPPDTRLLFGSASS